MASPINGVLADNLGKKYFPLMSQIFADRIDTVFPIFSM